MSDYENRPVPEGINYSQDNPLKEFAWLVLAVIGAVVALLLLLSVLAKYLTPLIPFSVEQRLAEQTLARVPASELTETQLQKQQYLRDLAAQLLAHQPLPEGMTLTLRYTPSRTINAFATLGGHIFILEGLIEKMPSENALAMVLAHEIAHILHRDPIVAMGRGVTVSLALMSITGLANSSAMDWLFQQVGLVTVMRFTREQEREADERALQMLQAHYGNVAGAERIFSVFAEQADGHEMPAFLSTHPLNTARIDRIREFARAHPQQGQPQALPAFMTRSETENP